LAASPMDTFGGVILISVVSCGLVIALIFHIFGTSRVARPKAHVCDRVVGLGTLQALYCVFEAAFPDAFIEAFVLNHIGGKAQNRGNCAGAKHDAQRPSEPVQDEGSTWLTLSRCSLKLGREMLQHVVPGIFGGVGKDAANLRRFQGTFHVLLAALINTDTGDKDIVDDGKAALAADPVAVSRADTDIVEDSGLVEKHAARVDGACKRHLLGVEKLEARLVLDIGGMISQDVSDGVGGKEDFGIGAKLVNCHKGVVHFNRTRPADSKKRPEESKCVLLRLVGKSVISAQSQDGD
jgi:hypothetical protein